MYLLIYIYSDHLYFRYSGQEMKRVVNCRFGLIVFRISVWKSLLVFLLDGYEGCVAAFNVVNFHSAQAGGAAHICK